MGSLKDTFGVGAFMGQEKRDDDGVEERDFIRRIAGHLFIRIRAAQIQVGPKSGL